MTTDVEKWTVVMRTQVSSMTSTLWWSTSDFLHSLLSQLPQQSKKVFYMHSVDIKNEKLFFPMKFSNDIMNCTHTWREIRRRTSCTAKNLSHRVHWTFDTHSQILWIWESCRVTLETSQISTIMLHWRLVRTDWKRMRGTLTLFTPNIKSSTHTRSLSQCPLAAFRFFLSSFSRRWWMLLPGCVLYNNKRNCEMCE